MIDSINRYCAICKDCDKIRMKRWYKNNSRVVIERSSNYRKADKQRKRKFDIKYRQKHLEHRRVVEKVNRHKREARKRGNGGSFTALEWKALCIKYNNKCIACGKKADLTPDHIIPLSREGRNDISNIQPLCLLCNMQKGTRTIDYR